MLETGATWFLLADGRRARLLVEPRRGAALSEPHDWRMEISETDLRAPRDRAPRSFDRVGAGRHAMDGGRDLHELEETNFLARVAARVTEGHNQGAFAHLVLAAPPRALGLLRTLLAPEVLACVRAHTAKDLLHEQAPALRERLAELLR